MTAGRQVTRLSRRGLLLGGLAVGGGGLLAACSGRGVDSPFVPSPAAPLTPSQGQGVVEHLLTPRPVTLDLGGVSVDTWAYGESLPGATIRATAGDLLRVRVDNQLPVETTVHWHGIRLRNVADGVPGLTQEPIAAGATYTYEFTAPDPGTYFFHPHVGVQLDRGLYAPLIIEDPAEPGEYDEEWVVVLDDWLDGLGRTPDDVFTELTGRATGSAHGSTDGMGSGGMGSGGMGSGGTGSGGMDHGSGGMGMGGMGSPPFGDAGDVTYPHFLINGRVAAAPDSFRARPGQRVRIRIINAAVDTIFSVALGGHLMTVTHSDGYPTRPREVGALYVGMGERYDVVVTLGDGVFPLVAEPFGKQGRAMALVRIGGGEAPAAGVRLDELAGDIMLGATLEPAESARLPDREVDTTGQLHLSGQMDPYVWGINGAPYGENEPVLIGDGERVRLLVMNMTMMTHPMHVHGHTFALPSGLRKDTVLVPPMGSTELDLDADNAGRWMIHCHNIYHAEAGMMIEMNYA